MPRWVIGAAGLLTFGAVYLGLQLLTLQPVQSGKPAALVQAAPTPGPAESLTRQIEPGQVALALPLGAAEPLMRGVQPGARINVLASLPEPSTRAPLSAVVARGARVLQPVQSGEPVLVEVAPADAVVLAHLVLGGTSLSYSVWSGDNAPLDSGPVDERTARALLGLAPRATLTPEPTQAPPATATPRPTALPTGVPTAVPTAVPTIADRYIVQPGDTLAGVAQQVGVTLSRMRAANPNLPDSEPLSPGMQLVVPQDT